MGPSRGAWNPRILAGYASKFHQQIVQRTKGKSQPQRYAICYAADWRTV
jgi:hypothetical protein